MTKCRSLALLGMTIVAGACGHPATRATSNPTPATRYDVVISGGKVVDGTGNAWFYGDVGVTGDRITFVGPAGSLTREDAVKRIDARGKVVSPGFIDIQSHSWDALLWRDGRVIGKVTQGVTTEILGESTTPAPINDEVAKLLDVPDTLKQVLELHKQFFGMKGFAAWLDALGRHANSVNVGSYLGATTVRAYAMGQRTGEPTRTDLDAMRRVVRNAMVDGAFGISSALIYPPGSYATTRELVEMAKAMSPYHGSYITHMRSEDDQLFEAMDEAFRIGREGNVSVDIYHLKAAGRTNWGKAAGMVKKVDSARAAGLDVAATMYPYAASGNGLDSCFPDWVAENGKLMENLRTPVTRQRLAEDMKKSGSCDPSQSSHAVIGFRKPELKKYEGWRIDAIMKDMNKPSYDVVIDLVLAENNGLSKINFSMTEENVAMQLKKPWVVIGSDAGGFNPDSATSMVHPRAYGSFARVLAKYVRADSVLTLEDAVRKMTGGTAARLKLRDRGLLHEGMFADIVVFDEKRIQDIATFDKPHQLSVGVEHVFVNGVAVVTDGKHTGATPGRVVRGPGYRSE